VYAQCQLKAMETGDERLLLELWVMSGLLALRLLYTKDRHSTVIHMASLLI